MEVVILYFSGTGNTALVANEMAERFARKGHQVECISVEEKERIEALSWDNKVVGIGFPVYKFTYPDCLERFLLKHICKGNPQQYFLFTTYTRFAGYALDDLSRYLKKKNWNLLAQANFKAPLCGNAARKQVTEYAWQSVMFFEDAIDRKIDALVEEVIDYAKNGRSLQGGRDTLKRKIQKVVVRDVEKTNYPLLQIDKNRCRTCGLCVKDCPWNAIRFGALSEGDNRYTIRLRDELYQKAVMGNGDPYWQQMDEVVVVKGFIALYCKSAKQNECKKKEYKLKYGEAPVDEIMPNGLMFQ